MELVSGQKIPLSNVLGSALQWTVKVSCQPEADVDVSCFAVDEQLRLLHDDYMTFYNQPQSPDHEVSYERLLQVDCFKFDVQRVRDARLQRFVICATSASENLLKTGAPLVVELCNAQQEVVLRYTVTAEQCAQLQAMKLIDIYRHQGVWRLGANGQGFDGGLAALVRHFGGDVSEAQSAAPANQVDLRKKQVLDKVTQSKPRLLDLTKKSLLSLEKKQLIGVKARLGLVLDRSGSMNKQYQNGDVQKVLERVVPLAVNFDDDGQFECWAFGKDTCRLEDVSLSNIENYVETATGGWRHWPVGAAFNYEPEAIEKVVAYYSQFNDGIPTYVVFVSDGGVSETRKITKLIVEAAKQPIFWQFVGIGGHNYGVLKKLDALENRFIDNCNFFDLDSIDHIADEQLYDLLLNEFPVWLAQAKQLGLVR